MTLAEKHRQLIENYSIIEDPQERLAAIVDAARRMPPLPAVQRTEGNRVRGCVSQTWLVAELRDGRCHFTADADSPLVRGLVKLLCDFYSGATPLEVATTEPHIVEELGVARNLSATRLNGLRSVTAKIQAFAKSAQSSQRRACPP